MPFSFTDLPPAAYITYSILAALLGCCVGSFLNVVIYRVPRNLSVGQPKRSFCPHCKSQIPYWLNIPILSWLMLRGKCQECSQPISPRYLGVELLTGLLFWAVFRLCTTSWALQGLGNPWMLLPLWIMVSLFVAGTFIDLEHYILPDSITLGGAAVGVLCSALVPDFFPLLDRAFVASFLPETTADRWQCLANSLVGAVVGYLGVWLIVILGKLLFGRKKHRFEQPTAWSLSQEAGAPEPIFRLGADDNPWSEMFSSPRDKLLLICPDAQINAETYGPSTLTIQEKGVTIAGQDGRQSHIPLAELKGLHGTCTEVIIPREAMGFGDVKFMACIGAFLGWQGVVFTLFISSILGAALSLLLIAFRGREAAQKVPFGPYLALGALLYLFYGSQIIQWWLPPA
jgi:leader peptidase (prepilin peptidase) / N-methyltransferase